MRWKVPVNLGLALAAVCLWQLVRNEALSYGLQLLLLITVVIISREIFVSGFRSLAAGHPGRDSLVAVSAAALIMILQFTPACAILAVESLGRWVLEAAGCGREAVTEMTAAEKNADRVSAVLAFAVLGCALAVGIVRGVMGGDISSAVTAGVAFCMVAFPEALIIAVAEPVAKASARSVKQGIIIRNREVLRQAWDLEEVVLDKMGTITEGMPVITDIIPIEGYFSLRMAGGLESRSNHPLGKAILEAALERPGRLEEFENLREHPGRGVSGERKGKRYLAGNRIFMEEMGVAPDYREGNRLLREGKTVVYFATGETIVGIIALRDGPRATSLKAVRMIESMGIDVTMLTGDSRITANAICREVGIDRAIAEIIPGDKKDIIVGLREGGRRKVAMASDRIRDREALESADVSFALGGESLWENSDADVVLESSNLCDVAGTIRMSRTAVIRGRENLVIGSLALAAGLAAAIWLFNPGMSVLVPAACSTGFAFVAPICEIFNSRRDK